MNDSLQVFCREAAATLHATLDAPLGLHDRLKFVAEVAAQTPHLEPGPHLLWRMPEGGVTAVPVKDGIIVGRGAGAGLVLPDGRVSQRHFCIVSEGAERVLTDDRSHNGTYVNGKKAARHVLRDGDVIEAGGQTLVFWRGGD